MKCPKCGEDNCAYGGRRARDIHPPHTLWYILFCECDHCELSFQTVQEIEKEDERRYYYY